MTRRAFLKGLSALVVAPSAFAQRTPVRIAWLSNDRGPGNAPMFASFLHGMRDLGYTEDRGFVIDARWGGGSMAKLQELALELVRSRPAVIVSQGGATAYRMKAAGGEVPVVFIMSNDPVEMGVVDSLARPGGNMTGVSMLSLDLVGKRMELLKTTIPQLRRVAILANPEHVGEKSELRVSRAAAKSVGLTLEYFQARNTAEIEEALTGIARTPSEAIVVFPEAFMMRHSERIAEFARANRMPAISGWPEFVERGNLLSYGPNPSALMRRVAFYADKVLKGAKPADVPVELPTTVELVVNLKAAKALGLAIPQKVVLRADRVIE